MALTKEALKQVFQEVFQEPLNRTYEVALEPVEGTRIQVRVASLGGITTWGESREEALENAKDLIACELDLPDEIQHLIRVAVVG